MGRKFLNYWTARQMRVGIALLVLMGGFTGAAGDWPQFLGPNGDGISPETGLINVLPKEGPPVVFKLEIGSGYSVPSVLGNRLVLFHRLGRNEVVDCLDPITGTELWRHAYPTSYVDPYGYSNGPRCAPLLTTNRCYTFGAEGRLTCLDLATGKVVWERDTAKDWRIPEAFFGVGSTPILEAGRLIVMLGGQPNSGVVGLDPETGRTLWESVGEKNWTGQPMTGWPGERTVVWNVNDKQASYASPVAATIHGQRQVFCLMRQGLVSLNPTNGQVNFSRWFRSPANDSVNAMNPVVVGNQVFCSAAYYRVGSFILEVNPDGKSFTEMWRSPRNPREEDEVLGLHWMTPIVLDGHIYASSGRNEPDASFRCVEWKTGKLKWERDESWEGHPPRGSKAQPGVFGRASLILADGKLIALGEGGLLGLFRATPEMCVELGRWQVPEMWYPCWGAPVLANRKLYLRSERWLVCLDLAVKEP